MRTLPAVISLNIHAYMQNLLAQVVELSLAAGHSQDGARFPATAQMTAVPATSIRSSVTITTCTPALSLSSNPTSISQFALIPILYILMKLGML